MEGVIGVVGNASVFVSGLAIVDLMLVRKHSRNLVMAGKNGDELEVGSEMIHMKEESWLSKAEFTGYGGRNA